MVEMANPFCYRCNKEITNPIKMDPDVTEYDFCTNCGKPILTAELKSKWEQELVRTPRTQSSHRGFLRNLLGLEGADN